jgi:hypothetical protein
MSALSWLPAVSTTSLLVLALWLFRSLIATRLTASVKHEFDEKIETLKTELRKSEKSFKADLRSKESEIEALRSGALSGLVSRQAALDARRIQAVDQLWTAEQDLGPAKSVSATVAILKFKYAVKESAENLRASGDVCHAGWPSGPSEDSYGRSREGKAVRFRDGMGHLLCLPIDPLSRYDQDATSQERSRLA